MAKQKNETPPGDGLPEVLTLALGETTDGRACVAWLTTRGEKVLRTVAHSTHETREQAEAEWLEEAYLRLFLRGAPSAEGKPARDMAHAHGLGLLKVRSTWTILEVEVDGDTVTRSTVLDASTDWPYIWERFDLEASRRLMTARKRKAA